MIDLKQLELDFKTGYRANFGARVGQTISGLLGRGAGGRFTRVGAGAPSSGTTNQPNAAKQQKRTAALQASGVKEEQAAALENFAKGGTLSAAQQADLVSAGLVRVGDDGTARLAPNARGFIRALRKGDARAAADAASAARDAGNRRTEAAQRKTAAAARREEAAKRRAQREADRAAKKNQPKPAKAPKQPAPLSPEATQRAGNRAEEVEAQIDDAIASDKTLTNAQLVKDMNRLDEIETQLQKASDGEVKTAGLETVARARKKLLAMQGDSNNVVTREASCTMEVFKDGSGVSRWLLITSNAYEDKEGEIVSRDALEADVERWWKRKEAGETWHDPLRWWHVGTVNKSKAANWQEAEAGEGMDIGQCDYCLMHGNMLIESGTFNSPELAAAFAPHMKSLRVSLGFATPWYQPIRGVYTDIHRFERSLLPAAKEANALTGGIVIKEKKDMTKNQDKVKAFATIAGEDAASVLSGFLDTAQQVDKQAEATGIRHKEGEAGADSGSPTSQEAQGEVESNTEGIPALPRAKAPPIASGRNTEAVTKEAAPVVEDKAAGDAPPADASASDNSGDGSGDAIMVGDMTPEELVAALAEPLAAAMAAAMKPVTQALSDQEAVIKSQGEKLAQVEKELGEAQAKVKELEGDAPKGGYRASQDAGTINKEAGVNVQPVNELAALAGQFLSNHRNGR